MHDNMSALQAGDVTRQKYTVLIINQQSCLYFNQHCIYRGVKVVACKLCPEDKKLSTAKKNPTLPQIKKHLQECLREAQPTEIMQVTQAMALLQEPDLHGILEKYIK